MARAAAAMNTLCKDGLRSSRCARLLPTLLLASLLVHDALLLLVALLRPSTVSAAYLGLCLLGYQGTPSPHPDPDPNPNPRLTLTLTLTSTCSATKARAAAR